MSFQLKIPACLSIVVRTKEDGGRFDFLERRDKIALPVNLNFSIKEQIKCSALQILAFCLRNYSKYILI